MPDSPSPFSIDTVLETLKKTTESITGFIQMVAGWIREKKWVELIFLILAAIILCGMSKEAIAKFLDEPKSQWFLLICLAVGILFIVAVIVAVFAKPSLSNKTQTPVERQSIKGLLSFTATDVELKICHVQSVYIVIRFDVVRKLEGGFNSVKSLQGGICRNIILLCPSIFLLFTYHY